MDALLLVDTTRDHLPSAAPQPLIDLVDRARGVGGVIVHVADRAADAADAADVAAGADADDAADADVQPQIDSVLGTTADELVLVSAVPDAFEGVEDLAEGLDDLGVDRIIVAGSNGRGALLESAGAALAIGFELTVVRDAIVGSGEWMEELEAAGAVVKNGADVWLKM